MEYKKIIEEIATLQVDVAKAGNNLGIKTYGDMDCMLLLTKSKVITKKRTYLDVAKNFKTFIDRYFSNNKNFAERINVLIDKIENSEIGDLVAFAKPTEINSLEIELINYRVATLLNLTK